MKLDVDFSALHRVVAKMTDGKERQMNTVTRQNEASYHLVHAMEPVASSIAICGTSPTWPSPLRPALFCLFFAEKQEGRYLSTDTIISLLVRFYGFKRVPLDEKAIEMNVYTAREEHCCVVDDILQQPLLQRDGLLQAIRAFGPVGFDCFEQLIEREETGGPFS
ncbi:hypothetical protein C9J12_21295 [Photobacterium frigidiphilum]|uniref:Uncharacterized protein n=1 Tax=Photobacterium frigidiphilum TaxID=264736 RepID=A0A2T3JA96_9GAMM|nr:hypothetical protein [Photobacterium frigidiphilum]PSU45777.1 hypothetical protein C9J12_21295 [Photobacterium frigidiphilum]